MKPKTIKSPNPAIDKALSKLMAQVNDSDVMPADMAVKVINSAIAWEKAKAGIMEDSSDSIDLSTLDE